MGSNRTGNQSGQTWEIQLKELQAEFGVDQGELFQSFLCVCNYLQRGWSFKRVMDAIENNSTIHSNVVQLFAVIGIKAISGKMGEMIKRSKCEANHVKNRG